MSKRLAVGPTPLVEIDLVESDLRLVGWENEELLARVDDESDLEIRQEKDAIKLTCHDDLVVNLPKGSRVRIQSVRGDMSVRGLSGELELESVQGDLAMRDVGKIEIGAIQADFSLRRAKGEVHVRSVSGDASIRELEGDLTLDSVADDLAVRAVSGNLKVKVEGDIVAQLEPGPEQEYALVAGDDIMVLLPSEANVTLDMRAEKINVELPAVEPEEGTSRVVTLGEGAAQVRLEAGGEVVVTNRLDAVESADEYGNFAGIMFDWGGFGRDLGEHISRRAQEVAERAARKAGAAGHRAARHGRHGLRGAAEIGRWKWDFPSGMPLDQAQPVSDEERMTILRMLADKKITAEQAADLLSALEGGE